ncbi:MAG TPA: hypothetical protein VHB21_11410 [Minicystis sp.]|nr:hypothetical protein [Minicystis sp.]
MLAGRSPDTRDVLLVEARTIEYARLMAAGAWRADGPPIVVRQGFLLDGGHRLSAVLLLGIAVELAVDSDGMPVRPYLTNHEVEQVRRANPGLLGPAFVRELEAAAEAKRLARAST